MIMEEKMRRAYARQMKAPLSASTPTSGLQELDPQKRSSASMAPGYNPQSAANQAQAGYLPPPAPPARAAVPPPTQPMAPTGGYARRADGSWGPATPSLTMAPQDAAVAVNQAPAQSAGGGAVSTKRTTTTMDPNAKLWPGPGGQRLTYAEWQEYQKVLNNPTRGMGPGSPADPPPGTGGVTAGMQGTGSQAAASNLTTTQSQAVQDSAGKTPYDDPLIRQLLDEVQGRMSGRTTASQERANDRLRQQADAARQEIDRRMAGRNLGATSPLRDKAYNDIEASVRDQIALRDAQAQEQAARDARELFTLVQSAKSADAYRRQIQLAEEQNIQQAYGREKQQGIDNVLGLLSLIPQAPQFVSGYNALKGMFGSGPSAPAAAPTNTEFGFRTRNLMDPYDLLASYGGRR